MNLHLAFRIKYISILQKIQRWLNPNFNQEHFECRKAKYLIVSRPCCGRTWLRVMIGLVMKEVSKFNLDNVNPQTLFYLHQLDPSLPSIKATHQPFQGKDSYLSQRVLLLVRDPRDALLSNTTKKIKRSEKLVEENFGYIFQNNNYFNKTIEFYNVWAEHRTTPKSLMMLRYEDLVENTHQELKRVCNFMGLDASDSIVTSAITNSTFDRMHKFDNRNFKFRSGKTKDFTTELSQEDLDWVEKQCILNPLNPFYGYTYKESSEDI